jgi:hypothetical protein
VPGSAYSDTALIESERCRYLVLTRLLPLDYSAVRRAKWISAFWLVAAMVERRRRGMLTLLSTGHPAAKRSAWSAS